MINVADVGGAVDSWFNSAHVLAVDGVRVTSGINVRMFWLKMVGE